MKESAHLREQVMLEHRTEKVSEEEPLVCWRCQCKGPEVETWVWPALQVFTVTSK